MAFATNLPSCDNKTDIFDCKLNQACPKRILDFESKLKRIKTMLALSKLQFYLELEVSIDSTNWPTIYEIRSASGSEIKQLRNELEILGAGIVL